ncbi:MAG: hypothetical protein F6K03_16805, partial [Kamptonema sp. SIO4C4]|nr:hypothetical protein [Kamptonema sp. SIO4C4]
VDAWDDIQEVEDEYELEGMEEWEENPPTRPWPVREMLVGVVLLLVVGGAIALFWPRITSLFPGGSPERPTQPEE